MSGRTSASQRGGGELGSSNYNPRGNEGGGEQKWYKSNSPERRSSFDNRAGSPGGDRGPRSSGGRGGSGRANDNGNFKSRSSFGGGRSS